LGYLCCTIMICCIEACLTCGSFSLMLASTQKAHDTMTWQPF
jgi:hypothetical protein